MVGDDAWLSRMATTLATCADVLLSKTMIIRFVISRPPDSHLPSWLLRPSNNRICFILVPIASRTY